MPCGKLSAAKVAERDAAITLALVAGEPWDSIAKRIGCAKQTISVVAKRLEAVGYDPGGAAEKRARFVEKFEEMAVAYMEMLTAQAHTLSDPDYLAKKATSDVIAHSAFVGDRFERAVRLQQGSLQRHPDALPERVTAEVVEGELLSDVA